jgi:hypothetical protein
VKDLQPTINDDRAAFAEIAQAIVQLCGLNPTGEDSATELLSRIRQQCEVRIVDIDKALGDV